VINSTAIFACSDIEKTLSYYRDVLGFESSWTWGEPPTFGGAKMDGASIMFCWQPELAERISGHQHWLTVDSVEQLYESHRSKGASIISDIEDKPWGFREYVVEDLNGYHLRFAGHPSTASVASKDFPEEVSLIARKPTCEEFHQIQGQELSPDLLEKTWNGIVALSPSGETIGILRIMWDAQDWYSIWDVIVTPEWRAQRIGSAMMKEAIKTIRQVSPSAIVHLFTFSHGFYERLGFKLESASVRRL
jgi:uncharacterized glyoxalase superfamily protein PhnB